MYWLESLKEELEKLPGLGEMTFRIGDYDVSVNRRTMFEEEPEPNIGEGAMS